jgi:hypothetical protein
MRIALRNGIVTDVSQVQSKHTITLQSSLRCKSRYTILFLLLDLRIKGVAQRFAQQRKAQPGEH